MYFAQDFLLIVGKMRYKFLIYNQYFYLEVLNFLLIDSFSMTDFAYNVAYSLLLILYRGSRYA